MKHAPDRAGLPNAIRQSLRHPGFVICTVTLSVLTAAFYVVAGQATRAKLPLPLRVPLTQLNRAALAPYEFVNAYMIAEEVLDQLGTREYIQWRLVDQSAPPESPTKIADLFITYYTGTPDPVPHVPENCYYGSGYQQMGSEDWEIDVPALKRRAPLRILEFERTTLTGRERPTVVYTFGANGALATDRNEVRALVGRPFERYAYFSKVEVRFESAGGAPATREEAKVAATAFFQRLLPLLVNTHWPDWEEVHRVRATGGPSH